MNLPESLAAHIDFQKVESLHLQLEHEKDVLKKAKKLEHSADLVAYQETRIADARERIQRFEAAVPPLIKAYELREAAREELKRADEAHKAGSLDARTARQLLEKRDVARQAFDIRTRELDTIAASVRSLLPYHVGIQGAGSDAAQSVVKDVMKRVRFEAQYEGRAKIPGIEGSRWATWRDLPAEDWRWLEYFVANEAEIDPTAPVDDVREIVAQLRKERAARAAGAP